VHDANYLYYAGRFVDAEYDSIDVTPSAVEQVPQLFLESFGLGRQGAPGG
jgi:hypothetical protein